MGPTDFFFFEIRMNSVTKLVTILALTLGLPAGTALGFYLDSTCTSNGFFRNSEDCTRFYRCVDLTGKGHFRKYDFSCPVGTVFDETVSVCNHPWAAPPCDTNEEEEVVEITTEVKPEEGGQDGENDGDDSVRFATSNFKFRSTKLENRF